MRKLFTLLTSLAIISSGASQVLACGENTIKGQLITDSDKTFDKWNLSTWGDKQKQIIVNSYLTVAKTWYQKYKTKASWSAWNYESYIYTYYGFGEEWLAINKSF